MSVRRCSWGIDRCLRLPWWSFRFGALAREEGNIAILGCDAHAPKDVWHPDIEEEALRLAEKYSLPVLRTAELRDL